MNEGNGGSICTAANVTFNRACCIILLYSFCWNQNGSLSMEMPRGGISDERKENVIISGLALRRFDRERIKRIKRI